MRFCIGINYEHPPRGPARKQYRMSDEALRARRRNLSMARLRSDRESIVIKRLIWQSCLENDSVTSQRALARQLGVWPSYVCKVQRKARNEGLCALAGLRGRVSLEDLAWARSFTLKMRGLGLLARARRPKRAEVPAGVSTS